MKEFKKYMIWAGILVLCIVFGDTALMILKIVGYIFVGVLSLLILVMLISFYPAMMDAKKVSRFMKINEGNYFLCYSSNKRLRSIIELQLKPLLNVPCEIVYTNREKIETYLAVEEYEHLLKETNTLKFPRLIKIEAGKVVAQSFYGEVKMLKQMEISNEEYKKQVLIKLNELKNE